MLIHYSDTKPVWAEFSENTANLMKSLGAHRILEIGAGANPTFTLDALGDRDINYTLLDISDDELGKAPPGYKTLIADIGTPGLELGEQFDFAFSRMLAEHIRDARSFHQNVFKLLRNGGVAVHFFPTLYAPPFVVNRLLPERLAHGVVRLLQPDRLRSGLQNKFPAYYDWCQGPTRRQLSRFQSLGYVVEEYMGCFGHDGYYTRMPWLLRLHNQLAGYLVQHPIAELTSFAYVVLRKP